MDPSLLTLRRFQWLWSCPDFLLSTGISALLQVRSLLLLDPHLQLEIKNPFDPTKKSLGKGFQQGQTGGITSRPFFLGKVALGHSSSKDFSFSAAPDLALLHLCPNEAVIN